MIEALLQALPLPPHVLAGLVAAAFAAGVVDAIAGGGGLFTVPALLAAGLPPHLALGTNKAQAVFGSGAALLSFSRRGLVSRERAAPAFFAALFGSGIGAAGVLAVPQTTLRPVVLGLLVVVALGLALRPGSLPTLAGPRPARPIPRVLALSLLIGAYDGFFGPGTGTFALIGFVILLGDGAVEASANAKVLNFASNLAAAVLFAARGQTLFAVALPMALAQAAGASIGARLAVRGGARAIRWVTLAVVTALAGKLAWELLS